MASRWVQPFDDYVGPEDYDADERQIGLAVDEFCATRVPLSEAIEVGKIATMHGHRAAFDRILEFAAADAAKATDNDAAARVVHRGTRLRAPKRPLSDAVKLEYVKWFTIEHQPDWESGEADIVLHLHLFEGLDKAFEAAREFVEARERKRNTELLEALMSTGAHGQIRSPDRAPLTEKQIKELNDSGSTIIGDKQCGIYKEYQDNRLSGEMYAGNPDGVETLKQYINRVDGGVGVGPESLPKDDPSIRDLFGGPHWRTHVARYFGFC